MAKIASGAAVKTALAEGSPFSKTRHRGFGLPSEAMLAEWCLFSDIDLNGSDASNFFATSSPSAVSSGPRESPGHEKESEDQMRILCTRVLTALAFAFLLTALKPHAGKNAASIEWPYYGNDPGAQRYSPLDQINRGNVSQLTVVWTYHTGEISNGQTNPHVANGKWRFNKTGFENTPIVVDGTMYISTPFCRVVALDPKTGTEKWSYDPQIRRDQP
jgi:PQQ-like domain